MDSLIEIFQRNKSTSSVKTPEAARPCLRKLPSIRAVVFDVYGTLFSSAAGDISLASKGNRNDILLSVFEMNGLKRNTRKDLPNFHDQFLNTIEKHHNQQRTQNIEFPEVEIRDVWIELIQSLHSEALIETGFEVEIESLAVEFESRINPVQKMPGLEDCLEELKKSGKILSIISNAQFYTPLLFEAFLGKTLEELGFCEKSSVWSYEMLEAKPSINLYKVAADNLELNHSIKPSEVLYVGNDMLNDIWPANRVGFRTALFAGDSLSLRRREDHPVAAKEKADIELTHLLQLPGCIG